MDEIIVKANTAAAEHTRACRFSGHRVGANSLRDWESISAPPSTR
jgi:hypothetical protein